MIYPEADGPLWISVSDGLIRMETDGALNPPPTYPAWIRRITTSGDSLLFDGQPARTDETPVWPYQINALRFAFAAPRYDAPDRTRLDGFDDHWSNWSAEIGKDYTNLSEGRYVFRVQARDAYGFESREDTFAFRILPPWHRTWWFRLIEGLGIVGLLVGLYKVRTRSWT